MTKVISDSDFQTEVMQAKELILVDFFADWCGPCQALAPVLDEVNSELKDVKILKVNIDDSPEVTNQYQVMSIPTLKLFKNGEVIDEKVGGQSKAELVEWINQFKG